MLNYSALLIKLLIATKNTINIVFLIPKPVLHNVNFLVLICVNLVSHFDSYTGYGFYDMLR